VKGGCGVVAYVHGRSRWKKECGVEDFLSRGLPNATTDVESVYRGGRGGVASPPHACGRVVLKLKGGNV